MKDIGRNAPSPSAILRSALAHLALVMRRIQENIIPACAIPVQNRKFIKKISHAFSGLDPVIL